MNSSASVVGLATFKYTTHQPTWDGPKRQDFAHKVVVVDLLPQGRTIALSDPNDEHEANYGRVFLRLPYLRFLLGYNEVTSLGSKKPFPGVQWTRHLFLYGDTKPFEREFDGFAMPLPNFSPIGFLTCPGTMSYIGRETPEEIAFPVIDSFWNSAFYATFLQGFPVSDGTTITGPRVLKQRLQQDGMELYAKLPRVKDLLNPRMEWLT